MKKNVQPLLIDDISATIKHLAFQLLTYGFLHFPTKKENQTNFLYHYRIVIIQQGSFQIEHASQCYTLTQGDCMIIAPHILCDSRCCEENSSLYYLDFNLESAHDNQQFQDLLHLSSLKHYANLINERQLNNLRHLDHTVTINFPGTYILVESMLMRILVVIFKRMRETDYAIELISGETAHEKVLLQCIDLIDSHPNIAYNVKDIAKELNYSENYIYKAFKETLNVSCKTFLSDYRLSKAMHDLKSSQMTISEIAEKYGFSSIYHFSSAFKKKYGFSPSNLRKEST